MVLPTPSLRRRLICMVYESLLVFSVIFVSALLYLLLTKLVLPLTGIKPSEDVLRHGMQAWVFLMLGLYFVHAWTRTGQTLAMKTWRIRVVDASTGQIASAKRATARYVLAWMWCLPALGLAAALDLHKWAMMGPIAGGFVLWAMSVWTNPQRQFLHDMLAGTRLEELPKPEKKADAADDD